MKTRLPRLLTVLVAGHLATAAFARPAPDPGSVHSTSPDPSAIEWVSIPAGTFTRGSPDDEVGRSVREVRQSVTLSAFRMSRFEITNLQFAAFLNAAGVGAEGRRPAGRHPDKLLITASSGETDWGLHYAEGRWSPTPGCERHPAINVTWHGADEFAAFVGARLPTEAQWEYACRAGTTTAFHTGENLTTNQANYDGNFPYRDGPPGLFRGGPLPVGAFPPNAYGLHDMHGNVWEWCADLDAPYSTEPVTDPQGGGSGELRVLRGGGWGGKAFYCRSANRGNPHAPERFNARLGFRVVAAP